MSFCVTGSTLDDFHVEYFVDGSFTEIAPRNAGNYKVKVSRAIDEVTIVKINR